MRYIFGAVGILSVSILAGGYSESSIAQSEQGWAAAETPVVIQGGTIIDVRNGNLLENSRIVVIGDKIESITQGDGGAIPGDAIILDAKGKFIIPGMLDIHIHYNDWSGPLYLNHGVTTVNSLGDTYEWIKAQKEGIKAGVIPGPRLFHGTENLDYTEESQQYFLKFFNRLVGDVEDARVAMRGYIADGANAVKVQDGLTVPQLKAIVAEANKANIPVMGHFKDVLIAAEVGGHGIEHTSAVATVLVDKQAQADAKKKIRKGLQVPTEAFMDLSKIPQVVKLMVEKNLYLNPTMRGRAFYPALREKGFHYEDFDLTFNDWRLRFMPLHWVLANLKEYQEMGLWNWRDLTEYEIDLFEQAYLNMGRLVKAFVDAGGKLYAGTDSANMSVPGLSMHQEMELMVAAGVSPLAALQSSTINSAELMRMDDRLGTVEVGMAGDLVILDGNPLQNIRNSRKIWRVISRGEVLDGEYHADYQNPIPKTTPLGTSHMFPSPRILTASPGTLRKSMKEAILKVEGSGFIPYSYIVWNGKKLKTQFVSHLELTARVPAELLEKAGTYTITVENPDFAWGTISARGGSDITHLGTRDNISNEFKVLVVTW